MGGCGKYPSFYFCLMLNPLYVLESLICLKVFCNIYEIVSLQSPAPSPFVKEMKDAGMFYGNRVLKDFKDR